MYNSNDQETLSKVESTKISFKIEEPNFTQMPNVLLDEWLPHLKETELKVLLVIYRKTFGWQKTKDQISLSQLSEKTGILTNKVIIAVKSLVEKKLIIKKVTGAIGLQKTVYEVVIQKKNTSAQKAPPPPAHMAPTKEKTLNKEKEIYKETNSASKDANILFKLFENEVNNTRKERNLKDIKIPRTKAQLRSLDDLLKDNTKDHITKIIKFAFTNDFWKKATGTPVFFKKQFSQIELQSTDSKKATKTDNRVLAQDFFERYKQQALIKNTRIEIAANEIEFIHTSSASQPLIISYDSKNFAGQLNNIKRKINLR